jgi:TonB family protein
MNALIIYMVKSAVYLAGFYIVYRLLLSRDTMYGRNRTFILLSVISGLILPLITVRTSTPINIPVFGKVISEIFVTAGSNNSAAGSDASTILGFRWQSIIYITGLAFFGLKLVIDFFELAVLIKRRDNNGTHIIRFHGFNTSGFSAFGYVFISTRLPQEEADEIIRHEQNHLNHYHSFDIVFIELIKVFQWFNPFIYLFSRSLRAVHEYQADEECISLGTSVNNYQRILLNQIFKSRVFTVSNSFSNPSLIKKRMIMMTKRRSKSLANLKLIVILPVVAMLMLAFSTCSEQEQFPIQKGGSLAEIPPPPPPPPVDSDANVVLVESSQDDVDSEPFVVVDQMPVFPGGEVSLLEHLTANIKYPVSAIARGIQGKVIIRFSVNPDGSVSRESVLKGVDPLIDEEALRVVRTLPRFEPGRQGGIPVSVWFMVPINFTLK